MNKILKQIALEQKWYHSELEIFNIVQHYFFKIGSTAKGDSPSFKYIEVRLPAPLEEDQQAALQATIKQEKSAIGFSSFTLNPLFLYLQFDQKFSSVKAAKLTQAVDAITTILKEVPIGNAIACHQCQHTTKSMEVYHLNQAGILLCDDCAFQVKQAFHKNNKDFEAQNTNYWQGLAGAILCSMGGVILWVLVAVLFNYITAVGAFLIAFLSQIGYTYFKGKPDENMKFFVIATGIFAIIFANIITYLVDIMQEGISISEAFQLLQEIEPLRNSFLQNLGLSLFFGAIVWFFMLFDNGREELQLEKAKKMMDTV